VTREVKEERAQSRLIGYPVARAAGSRDAELDICV
jgi:hypothetical protein